MASEKNLKLKKEFTVSFATKKTMVISDYFGLESGHDADKISKKLNENGIVNSVVGKIVKREEKAIIVR